ncbi:MAG: hypothetical protein K1000chlam3_00554 [Chlamydiae bacterium]|nr:hypothetical protein [Chlamydiota bacterium]
MISIVGSQSNPGEAFLSKDHSQIKEETFELFLIRKKIDALAKRMGIEVPYKLKIGDGWGAQYRFSNKKHIIMVPKEALNSKSASFYLMRYDAMSMMHELAHLEKKHRKMILLEILMYSSAFAILGAVCLPFLWLGIGTEIVFCFSVIFVAYLKEKEADAIACQYATDQEKLHHIYSFKYHQANYIQYRNQKDLPFLERWKRKIQVTSSGDSRFDVHPYTSNRIRMIESTMKVKPKKYLPLDNYLLKLIRADKRHGFLRWSLSQVLIDKKGNPNPVFNKIDKGMKWLPIFLIEQAVKLPFFVLKYHFAPRSALEDEII